MFFFVLSKALDKEKNCSPCGELNLGPLHFILWYCHWVTETLPCDIPSQDFCAVLFNELMNYNKHIARKNMENTTKQTCSSSSSGKGRRFFLMRSWSSTWINLKKSWCMTLAWEKYKLKKKKKKKERNE